MVFDENGGFVVAYDRWDGPDAHKAMGRKWIGVTVFTKDDGNNLSEIRHFGHDDPIIVPSAIGRSRGLSADEAAKRPPILFVLSSRFKPISLLTLSRD